jgi:hypothetical protein
VAHDAFISYSSKDKAIADAVCARLEQRGIRCWIAPRDVQPGAPYGEEIIDAIHSCRVMVLVLSSNANASPHIPKEVERAVSHGVSVIPLRVEAVAPAKSLDYFISSVHWLDAITPPLEQHLESLANTIRTLLPQGASVTAPPLESPRQPRVAGPGVAEPQVAEQRLPATAPAPPSGQKPNLLFAAIAVGVLVLAATAWFLWLKPQQGETRYAPITTTEPMQPGIRNSPPGGASSMIQPSGGVDPVVGCWHWFNNVQVAINSDGTMTAGPFTAHWRLANAAQHVYHFTWPEAVDSVVLSPDGRTIAGGNQYGTLMNAARLTPGSDLAGSWRWYNGVIVNISPNGTFTAGTTGGRWQRTAAGYALTWPPPVDTVTLSNDQRRVNGSNQYGFHISGTKTGACGG